MEDRLKNFGKVRIVTNSRFLYILFIGISLASCKKENRWYTARITVLNAVPDAAALEVYSAGDKLNATTLFGVPDYHVEVPAVTDSIKWRISGQSGFDSSFVADLPNGTDFTLLFFDSASRLGSFMVKDNWQQPASDRKSYYRFFPMIVNANALQITNDTGKVLIAGRGFADFRNKTNEFSSIDTTKTKLRLVNNSVLLDSIPNATFISGKSYTIYAVGVLNAMGSKRPRMIIQEHN